VQGGTAYSRRLIFHDREEALFTPAEPGDAKARDCLSLPYLLL
jgi:hypothetical protein